MNDINLLPHPWWEKKTWTVNLHPWWEDPGYRALDWIRVHVSEQLWWKLAYHFELYRSGVYGHRFDWLD
jgi:hypothetical protein